MIVSPLSALTPAFLFENAVCDIRENKREAQAEDKRNDLKHTGCEAARLIVRIKPYDRFPQILTGRIDRRIGKTEEMCELKERLKHLGQRRRDRREHIEEKKDNEAAYG